MKVFLVLAIACLFMGIVAEDVHPHHDDDDDDYDGDDDDDDDGQADHYPQHPGGRHSPYMYGVHGHSGHRRGPIYRRPVSPQEHSDIEKLYLYLTRHYHHQTRPCRYTTCEEASHVKFSMSPLSFGLNFEKNYLFTNYWLKVKYTEPRFTWDPRDFGGISQVNIPQEELWMPDIEVFNDAKGGEYEPWSKRSLAIASSHGEILAVPKGFSKTWCHFNATETEQHCQIKFGSWTYAEKEVDVQIYDEPVTPPECDLEEFNGVIAKGDWKLSKCRVERHSKVYDCCPDDHYVDITYHLTFTGEAPSF